MRQLEPEMLTTTCKLVGTLTICCDECPHVETKTVEELGLEEPNESYNDDDGADVFRFHGKSKCPCGQEHEVNVEIWLGEDAANIDYCDDSSFGCETGFDFKTNISATAAPSAPIKARESV